VEELGIDRFVVRRAREGADADLLQRVDEIRRLGPAPGGHVLDQLHRALVERGPEQPADEAAAAAGVDRRVGEDRGELP
jgi:hypothetical protein